ncbi:MAG: PilZ domain-containing protein [Pseudomonadota bacterium]|nr:PilZ domain-containing protein [Pseudomonadota bacterium]
MPPTSPRQSEQRDFIRLRVNTEIRLTLNQPRREIIGVCRNLSGAGMLVELEEALETGTVARATVASAYGERLESPDFRALVEVTRCDPAPEGRHLHGCVLLEILE